MPVYSSVAALSSSERRLVTEWAIPYVALAEGDYRQDMATLRSLLEIRSLTRGHIRRAVSLVEAIIVGFAPRCEERFWTRLGLPYGDLVALQNRRARTKVHELLNVLDHLTETVDEVPGDDELEG